MFMRYCFVTIDLKYTELQLITCCKMTYNKREWDLEQDIRPNRPIPYIR